MKNGEFLGMEDKVDFINFFNGRVLFVYAQDLHILYGNYGRKQLH